MHFSNCIKLRALSIQFLLYRNFRKKRTTSRGIPQFSKLCYQKFQFHLISLLEFPFFGVEWIAPLFCKKKKEDFWHLFLSFVFIHSVTPKMEKHIICFGALVQFTSKPELTHPFILHLEGRSIFAQVLIWNFFSQITKLKNTCFIFTQDEKVTGSVS